MVSTSSGHAAEAEIGAPAEVVTSYGITYRGRIADAERDRVFIRTTMQGDHTVYDIRLVSITVLRSLPPEEDPDYVPPPQPPPPPESRISVKYDRFEDRTVLTMGPGSSDGCSFATTAVASSTGKTFRPTVALVSFWQRNDSWQHLDFQEISFLVNGQRFVPQVTDYDSKANDDGTVTERFDVFMTLQQFRRFASAKIIEFRAGTTECRVSTDDLAALRAFASRFTATRSK